MATKMIFFAVLLMSSSAAFATEPKRWEGEGHYALYSNNHLQMFHCPEAYLDIIEHTQASIKVRFAATCKKDSFPIGRDLNLKIQGNRLFSKDGQEVGKINGNNFSFKTDLFEIPWSVHVSQHGESLVLNDSLLGPSSQRYSTLNMVLQPVTVK